MDDELQHFEAELKRLRPAAPSRDLIERIGGELESQLQPRRIGPAWWVWAGALPIAAALAVVVTFLGRRDHGALAPATPEVAAIQTPAPKAFQPVAAENILYAARDEGLVTLSDGTPARQERLNYVDTITWKDSRTNASVRWSVPREEVRVVPVNFQ